MPRYSIGFSRKQIVLHWLVAVLVLSVFLSHEKYLSAAALMRQGRLLGPIDQAIILLHVWAGGAVLPLALCRLMLRLRLGVPAPAEQEHRSLQVAATIVHVLLYGVIIVFPISGFLAYLSVLPPMSVSVHRALGPALVLLVLLHVTGSLMHLLVWKTDVFTRMIRSDRSSVKRNAGLRRCGFKRPW